MYGKDFLLKLRDAIEPSRDELWTCGAKLKSTATIAGVKAATTLSRTFFSYEMDVALCRRWRDEMPIDGWTIFGNRTPSKISVGIVVGKSEHTHVPIWYTYSVAFVVDESMKLITVELEVWRFVPLVYERLAKISKLHFSCKTLVLIEEKFFRKLCILSKLIFVSVTSKIRYNAFTRLHFT